MLIVKKIIDNFCLPKICQKNLYEQGLFLFLKTSYPNNCFFETEGRQKLGFFSLMKYFGFIEPNCKIEKSFCKS